MKRKTENEGLWRERQKKIKNPSWVMMLLFNTLPSGAVSGKKQPLVKHCNDQFLAVNSITAKYTYHGASIVSLNKECCMSL